MKWKECMLLWIAVYAFVVLPPSLSFSRDVSDQDESQTTIPGAVKTPDADGKGYRLSLRNNGECAPRFAQDKCRPEENPKAPIMIYPTESIHETLVLIPPIVLTSQTQLHYLAAHDPSIEPPDSDQIPDSRDAENPQDSVVKHWYQRWWIWALIGVAIAGAGAFAYFEVQYHKNLPPCPPGYHGGGCSG